MTDTHIKERGTTRGSTPKAPPRATATIVDVTATARTATRPSRAAVERWVAGHLAEAETRDRTLAIAITEPGVKPLVLVWSPGAALQVYSGLTAPGLRWVGRAPRHTVVVLTDGAVDLYDTRAETEEKDQAGLALRQKSAIYPDNAPILMVDIGRGANVLTAVGPGATDVTSIADWLSAANGKARHTRQQ